MGKFLRFAGKCSQLDTYCIYRLRSDVRIKRGICPIKIGVFNEGNDFG